MEGQASKIYFSAFEELLDLTRWSRKSQGGCRLKFEAQKVWYTRYEEYMAKKYKEYGDKTTREVIFERVKKFAECLRR